MPTYIIGILHDHGGDFGNSLGHLEANDSADALERAALWTQRKKKESGCERDGSGCPVIARLPFGVSAIGLINSAEEIDVVREQA